jgi:hypothetical protein
MGYYTELIFGAALKQNTPSEVIDTIKWLLDKGDKTGFPAILPQNLKDTRLSWMFNSGGSYYFGSNSGYSEFKYDEIGKFWRLNARFNIKNYENEIEGFLEWIKPYLEQGSGEREFYAIVTTEDGEPKIYYLNETDSL